MRCPYPLEAGVGRYDLDLECSPQAPISMFVLQLVDLLWEAVELLGGRAGGH